MFCLQRKTGYGDNFCQKLPQKLGFRQSQKYFKISKESEMNAIIVAAGMGKRLRGFTSDKPKCMIEINGISLFERQTELLLRSGISEINVVTGYRREWFTNNDFVYHINTDYENNNILHSLFCAETAMDTGFLFSYSDIIYDADIVRQMLDQDSGISIAVDTGWEMHYDGRLEHPITEAELVFSEDGKTVSSIHKNGDHKNARGEFLGLACFSERGAKDLKKVFGELRNHYEKNPEKPFHSARSFNQAYLTDMLQEMVDRGHDVRIIEIAGKWAEIDTPEDLRSVQKIWTDEKENSR